MKLFMIFVLATVCFFTGGCFEEIGKGVDDFTGSLFSFDTKSDATVAEINAVGKLGSDSMRAEGFITIAGRNGLTSRSQLHLIETSLNKLNIEDLRVKVLLGLINNRDFSHEAKKKILNNLSRLKIENSRIKVVQAINARVIGVQSDIPPSAGKIEAVLSVPN